jgi:ribosomal protein S17
MLKFTAAAKLFFFPGILFCFSLPAQDSNIKYPLQEIEKMLRYDAVEIAIPRDVRFKGDKAKTAILKRDDGFFIRVKIKRAAQGGENYNNQPRYEIAAYLLQKLFLNPEEYIVPPTAGRAFSIEEYEKIETNAFPTFKNSPAVYCLLQYWLDNVSAEEILDEKRLASDSVYSKHIGNLNIFTYLIRHSDSNIGNFLISTDSLNSRVFAVDNEMAFGDITSERGYEWRNLVVKRFPRKTVKRLQKIQLEDLQKILAVVEQYEIREGQLVPVEATEPLDTTKGVRQSNDIIQLGLTEKEIKGVYKRLKEFLEKVDSGKIETF